MDIQAIEGLEKLFEKTRDYQISVAFDTGDRDTISGATNSGEPYLLYWGSTGVILWANPKSQIFRSSLSG